MLVMPRVVVRTYKGSQDSAAQKFQNDAAGLAIQGYVPVTQSYAPGSWGCGAFAAAALLCLLFVGFFVFIYMALVKPAGTLTVTYDLRLTPTTSAPQA